MKILQHGSTNVDRNRLMPFVSVLVDFLVVCCWWWTVKRYMEKYEREYGVDAKMRGVDVEQIKCGTVVGDGVKVDDKIEGIVSDVAPEKMTGNISKCGIPTISKDSLDDSCEKWLEKVRQFRGVGKLVDLYFGDEVQGGLAHVMVNFGTPGRDPLRESTRQVLIRKLGFLKQPLVKKLYTALSSLWWLVPERYAEGPGQANSKLAVITQLSS
ncbi:13443_t:CDS:2 [Ambispora leptoticha]|uniref:13443_t:CDS:1 n=1 Tax=Ambispora leptoticha TaxID=144679 RepID=A0A9N9EAJ9_9GLOM|nr:13443_t:CDS:2 [Ambispora leptoticha]